MANKLQTNALEFEIPILELENQLAEMKDRALAADIDLSEDIEKLRSKVEEKTPLGLFQSDPLSAL
jgi:acetyl-CoA carboxylase alpha subunit